MRNTKRELNPYSFYDTEGLARHFERMALGVVKRIGTEPRARAAALAGGPAMCSAQRMKTLWMLRLTLFCRWTRCTAHSNITTV